MGIFQRDGMLNPCTIVPAFSIGKPPLGVKHQFQGGLDPPRLRTGLLPIAAAPQRIGYNGCNSTITGWNFTRM